MSASAVAKETTRSWKERLRREMRERREALSAAVVAEASRFAQERILALESFGKARRVALYSAARNELATSLLAQGVLGRGAKLAYPRVEEGRLVFREVKAVGELEPGGFGLLEPSRSAPEVAAADLEFVLVPGLAFDANGSRLGFGKGFYDRTLAALPPRAATAGFCHDFQLIGEVPQEAGDVPVAEVITDLRRVRCLKAKGE